MGKGSQKGYNNGSFYNGNSYGNNGSPRGSQFWRPPSPRMFTADQESQIQQLLKEREEAENKKTREQETKTVLQRLLGLGSNKKDGKDKKKTKKRKHKKDQNFAQTFKKVKSMLKGAKHSSSSSRSSSSSNSSDDTTSSSIHKKSHRPAARNKDKKRKKSQPQKHKAHNKTQHSTSSESYEAVTPDVKTKTSRSPGTAKTLMKSAWSALMGQPSKHGNSQASGHMTTAREDHEDRPIMPLPEAPELTDELRRSIVSKVHAQGAVINIPVSTLNDEDWVAFLANQKELTKTQIANSMKEAGVHLTDREIKDSTKQNLVRQLVSAVAE